MSQRKSKEVINEYRESGRPLSDIDWSFPNADTQEYTHGIHPYPARMIPQIPDYLISHFKSSGDIEEGNWIFDPFAGSGTTGIVACRHGLNSILIDINPLACMISKASTNPPNPETITEARRKLYGDEFSANPLKEGLIRVTSENFPFSIDLDSNYEWFPEPQLTQLGYLKERINLLGRSYDDQLIRWFKVALSETSRRVSYQRNDEFKRYRISEDDRTSFEPDVWKIFTTIVDRNLSKTVDYLNEAKPSAESLVYNADARMPSQIDTSSVDLIITSPPYGDHSTTVAYGQFSKDPAIISNGVSPDEMREVDKNGLGGDNHSEVSTSKLLDKSGTLEKTIEKLEQVEGRSEDAIQFFSDYYETIKQTRRVLKPGQPIVLVVANRTMSRINIPTHKITKELYYYLDFEIENVIPRDIPTKTLPFENNPEGRQDGNGDRGNLMAEEYILMMRLNSV